MSSLISRIGARGLLSSSSRILAANPNLHTSAPAAEVVTVDGKRASVRGNWMNAHNYKKGDREIHNSIHIRGHSQMTSAKFSGFWTPSPPLSEFLV